MANEFTETYGITLTNGNLTAQFPQRTRQSSQTTSGISDTAPTIGTSEEDVTFPDLTTPGKCILHNLDSTNYVEYGPKSGGSMVLLGKLQPGEVQQIRLGASVTLRLKANTAACKVRVMCFET